MCVRASASVPVAVFVSGSCVSTSRPVSVCVPVSVSMCERDCVREGVKSLYVMMLFRAAPQMPIRNTHTNMRTHTNTNLSASQRLTHPPKDRERDARAHAHTHTHTQIAHQSLECHWCCSDVRCAPVRNWHALSLSHTHTHTYIYRDANPVPSMKLVLFWGSPSASQKLTHSHTHTYPHTHTPTHPHTHTEILHQSLQLHWCCLEVHWAPLRN